MIDEIAEVKDYINGKNVSSLYEYRAVYLMARYYLSQGLNRFEVRDKIFEWGNRVGHFIRCNVNNAVSHASMNQKPLRSGVTTRISDDDIREINRHFDNRRVKWLALAVLAYGKAVADEHGECDISLVGLAEWLDLDYSSVRRWIKEMIDFSYIEKIDVPRRKSKKRNPVSRIRFLVPLRNIGEHIVEGNNIAALANLIF